MSGWLRVRQRGALSGNDQLTRVRRPIDGGPRITPAVGTRYLAWDGEGVGHPKHRYVLLAHSGGTHIANADGLSSLECIDFVWREAQRYRRHRHVIYAGSYDFNCWLRNLPFHKAAIIHAGYPVRIGDYVVRYRRSFEIWRRGHPRDKVEISDVWTFWQGSFVKALRTTLPDHPQLQAIEGWKAKRSEFDVGQLPDILRYCYMELEALDRLMQEQDRNLDAAGIGRLRRLDGAGSGAAKLLSLHHVRGHLGQHSLPPDILAAARSAYSGGRIEPWRLGRHQGPFYTYDIRSAYPSAMLELPSLSGGEWRRTRSLQGGKFALYKVNFCRDQRKHGYPFFQRFPDGSIRYPERVNGWYWKPELDAAVSAGFSNEFMITDGWEFVPEDDTAPFAWIVDRYAQRAALKAAGKIGAQQVLKLFLNSLYGKLAQTLGGNANKWPPFHQIAWAGYVTSHCRAKVYSAAMTNPDAVAYLATDGIGSVERLDVELGDGLGQWEAAEYAAFMLVQAGIYFLWTADGQRHDKYRGFDRGAIDPDKITAAWQGRLPNFTVPSTRFITIGSALASQERFTEQWCDWRTIDRTLDIWGSRGKRELWQHERQYPHKQLEPLYPRYDLSGTVESAAYRPQWERKPALEQIDGVDVDTYMAEIMAADGGERNLRIME